ncbi:MAG: hypothetical protein RO009_14245 [Pseudorhodoplanes sp.]|nr:hypothetical protein [Pseudorhodoplanes sp.]
MAKDKIDTEYSKKEAAKRRDDALRRALMTPPKPHTKPAKSQKRTKKKAD